MQRDDLAVVIDAQLSGRAHAVRRPSARASASTFSPIRRILARIADAVALTSGETVVEIGPGRGALTEALLARAARVVAIEIDRKLVRAAAREVRERERRHDRGGRRAGGESWASSRGARMRSPGTCRTTSRRQSSSRRSSRRGRERSVLLVQREVAARMAAAPGADDYGALSVNVQAMARTSEMLFRIPAGAFMPPPQVESAVVRVTPRADPVVRPGEEQPFRTFVQAAFALRRKQMRRVMRTIAERSAEDAERALAASRHRSRCASGDAQRGAVLCTGASSSVGESESAAAELLRIRIKRTGRTNDRRTAKVFLSSCSGIPRRLRIRNRLMLVFTRSARPSATRGSTERTRTARAPSPCSPC